MTARLRLKEDPGALPVESEALTPDRIAGLARRDVERLPLIVGNRAVAVGDLFEVSGDGAEEVEIEGDLSGFALVGAGMSRGRLTVHGPAGARAGSRMSGGTLAIEGGAGPYAGQGMAGGLLKIGGDAGAHLAAPAPGRPSGMNRGAIVVRGGAGEMAAGRMRRGTIVVVGDVGPGAGCGMLAGSLFVLGRLGAGAGALMRRGTIVALGPPPGILPVFLDAGRQSQPFLNLYYSLIEAAGIALPGAARHGLYRRLVGDISDLGKGEILVLEGGA